MLSFIGLMLVCFVVSKVIGPMFRCLLTFNFTCTSDSYVTQLNLSATATLRTEESSHCRDVAIMASSAINVWKREGSMICTLYLLLWNISFQAHSNPVILQSVACFDESHQLILLSDRFTINQVCYPFLFRLLQDTGSKELLILATVSTAFCLLMVSTTSNLLGIYLLVDMSLFIGNTQAVNSLPAFPLKYYWRQEQNQVINRSLFLLPPFCPPACHFFFELL